MSESVIVTIVLAVVVGGIIIIALVSEYKSKHRTCKKCGKSYSMTITDLQEVPKGGNNKIFFRTETWTCGKCGYQEITKKTVNYGTNSPSQMARNRQSDYYDED